MTWTNVASLTATDVQSCVDAAYETQNSTKAISFDATTGACVYATAVNGYMYRSTGPPDFYLRADGWLKTTDTCLSNQDAEYLLLHLSYEGAECPPSYQLNGAFCWTNISGANAYGVYTSAYDSTNATKQALTRTQALASIGYQCPNVADNKMVFNGIWYCYSLNNAIALAERTRDTIANNYCNTITSGSAPIMPSEPREYAWAWWLYMGKQLVYIGAMLQSGTTFTWHDGSPASNLPFAVGRPNNTGNKTLVTINRDGTVTDRIPDNMVVLTCKILASNVPYDSTARFN
ncbi:hypothetical protein AAVH_42763 [Aphelenchoides avenae]|nr:hypothetical protein AAVH_42763 [Aphelenchus avenae]